MEDQRLTPLPAISIAHPTTVDYPPGYDGTVDNIRSIRQYFNIVYKRLPLLLAITVFITGVVAFYSYRQPSIYQSQVRMIIEPRKPQITLKDAISINMTDDQKYHKTQLQLLQSQDLMKRTVVALGLHRDPNLFGDQNRGVAGLLRTLLSGAPKPPDPEDISTIVNQTLLDPAKEAETQLTPEENARAKRIVKMLTDESKVEQVDGTNILTVTVQDANPALAVKVAYKMAELFIDEDTELETKGAQKAYKNLGESIEELKGTIAQQETELIETMRSSGLPLQEKGQDLAASRLSGMSDSWIKTMETRRELEARYNAAVAASDRGEGMNIPNLYENKVYQDTARLNTERRAKLQDQIRDIDKQIQDAETLKAQLLVTYTPAYAKVKEQVERIAALKAGKETMQKDVSRIIDLDQKKVEKEAVNGTLVSLKSQLDAAVKQENESQAAYDREAASANAQGQTQTKLTTLKRELETNRSLLDTYTQRQKEQELALSTGKPNNIKIQNRAVMPDEPIGPQRSRNILIAFFLALGAGTGLVFLLDYLDDSVRTSDDVTRHLGLPTLAVIPQYVKGDAKKSLLLTKAEQDNTPALVTLRERHSPMTEAYKHLRTSILFSSAGKPPQIILITSARQSEGKTSTAINTAITLAQSGDDVVIVDCDLRRPRLHSHFGLENNVGITNYLSGGESINNIINTYGHLPNLKIIPCGPVPPNPTELLSSKQMGDLLGSLSGRFQHVIIDSPPAISFTDASILSTLVDGVVLIAMANKSSIYLLRQLKNRISNIGARIYGVVINGVTAGSTENEYYNYYPAVIDDPSEPPPSTPVE